MLTELGSEAAEVVEPESAAGRGGCAGKSIFSTSLAEGDGSGAGRFELGGGATSDFACDLMTRAALRALGKVEGLLPLAGKSDEGGELSSLSLVGVTGNSFLGSVIAI